MPKPRNRLPAITDLGALAGSWGETDAQAQARRERERIEWEQRVLKQEHALALKRDNERRALILKAETSRQWRILAENLKRTMEQIAPLPREPTVWAGSSISGPAPGPHYPYHLPGPGVPAHLHDGGRGTGGTGGVSPRSLLGDYLLTDD